MDIRMIHNFNLKQQQNNNSKMYIKISIVNLSEMELPDWTMKMVVSNQFLLIGSLSLYLL